MKRFIGYFDYLGYKEFILNNSEEHLRRRASHILRDIEISLSQDKLKDAGPGRAVADLSSVNINCLNISDTVIFWTPNDTIDTCVELLNVCYMFNLKQVLYNFPVRGCIIYDNFDFVTGQEYNPNGVVYSPNLMYGKGLLNAHIKSESLDWAGSVIDSSVIERVSGEKGFPKFIDEIAIEYDVPYKGASKKEYALRLSNGELNDTAYANWIRDINRTFEMDNKIINESVERKRKNTIDFLSVHREPK
ncbi:MAG: hypothetical protein QM687_03630 [Ferruginibacter sp.]